MMLGDIVCAISAYCGEGAARCYVPDAAEVEASPDLVESLRRLFLRFESRR
jgi:hypothetical protein